MTTHGVDRSGAAGGSGSPSHPIDEELIDAKGDLLVGTAPDTIDRLAVGSDNFILVADSAEGAGIKWAGGSVAFQAMVTTATAETAPAAGDIIMVSDVSLAPDSGRAMTLADLLKVINDLTAETAPAVADLLAMYDADGNATDKITLENLLKVINSLTEDTAPLALTDFALTYDASAAGVKKAALNKLGNLVLIQTQTVSGVATVDFTTGIDGTYETFVVIYSNVVPQTDNTDLYLRTSSNGGSSFDAAGNYRTMFSYWTSGSAGGTFSGGNSDTSTFFQMGANLGNATGEQISGHFEFVRGGTNRFGMHGQHTQESKDARGATGLNGGTRADSVAVNAIRMMISSGNISGTFSLYGVKKA